MSPTVLAHYWQQLGHTYDPADRNDAEAANAITTITGSGSGFVILELWSCGPVGRTFCADGVEAP